MSCSTGDFIQPEAPSCTLSSSSEAELSSGSVTPLTGGLTGIPQAGMRARYLIIKFLSQRSHKGHVGRSKNTIQSILGPRNSFHVSILAFISLSKTKITVKNVDSHPVLIFYFYIICTVAVDHTPYSTHCFLTGWTHMWKISLHLFNKNQLPCSGMTECESVFLQRTLKGLDTAIK